jgi:hypothetical protein
MGAFWPQFYKHLLERSYDQLCNAKKIGRKVIICVCVWELWMETAPIIRQGSIYKGSHITHAPYSLPAFNDTLFTISLFFISRFCHRRRRRSNVFKFHHQGQLRQSKPDWPAVSEFSVYAAVIRRRKAIKFNSARSWGTVWQAGKQEGRQAGRQTGRQAAWQATWQPCKDVTRRIV